VEEATGILEQMLEAFGEAHAAGVVHRDIKPQNIMLSRDGVVKVMDFGIAKLRRPDSGETVTQGGQGGTLKYMSPEQVSSLEDVDDRSDLYAIGMTAYEMLTGSLPFEGAMTDFDIMQAIVEGRIPPPRSRNPDLSPALNEWVETATAKQQDDRFQSAERMLEALRGIDAGEQKAAPAPDERASDPDRTQTVLDPSPPSKPSGDTPGSAGKAETPEPEGKSASDTDGEGTDGSGAGGSGTTATTAIAAVVLFAVLAGGYWMATGSSDSAPARLTLSTAPSDATVRINGEAAGKTPISQVALPSGPVTIQIRKDGYRTIDTTLQAAGPGTAVRLTGLALRPERGLLTVSSPEGATVYVDGRRRGVAPLSDLPAQAGRHQVRVELDGQTVEDSVDIEAGETLAWTPGEEWPESGASGPATDPSPSARQPASTASSASNTQASDAAPSDAGRTDAGRSGGAGEAEPVPRGRVAVQDGTPGATLIVEGTTRAAGRTHSVRAGERTIRCRHPEFSAFEETITVAEGETVEVGCYYRQPVSVNMIGAWGNVIVDGENTGRPAPTTVRLDPGEHTIGLSVERNDALNVNGGTYRREVAGETTTSGSFSGSVHAIVIEPRIVPVRSAVVFRVEK
jgi:serine/threonine-protein kinase